MAGRTAHARKAIASGVADAEPNPSQDAAKQLFSDGLAALDDGRLEDAERAFLASLEALPGRVPTLLNLATTRLRMGRPVEANAAAGAVLAGDPDHVDALALRSDAFAMMGLTEHALAACDRALAADPRAADVWSRRGGLLRQSGRLAEAGQAFGQAIAYGGDAELNGYYRAAVGRQETHTSAPSSYVAELFDNYSAGFDAHLVGVLGYRAPTVLVEHLEELATGPFRSALDLGCGTGLCGRLVKPRVARLTGVDLAPRMLDQARALGVYDRLERAEVVAWLGTNEETFDLILAADVLVYIGELEPLFAAVRRALDPDGMFCFSVELADSGDFTLLPSLRYAHSERYVRELAAQHGFAVARMLQAPLRLEAKEPIAGLYGYLRSVTRTSRPRRS